MPGYLSSAGAAALLVATPCAALAASPPTVADLVVTGVRAPGGVSPDRLGGSLTVLDAQTLEDRQVRIVSDVLRDVPGLAVSRTGGVGAFTQVRVRGAESNHVLTLIDGIKASDPFYGEFDHATLLADDVARVEVVRGEQSALYGSDAIGGVINYITPTGSQSPGLRLRAEGGSMGTWGGAGRAAGVEGDLDYVLSGGYQATDGYVVAPGGQRRIGSELGSLAGKFAYQLTPHLRLRAVGRYTSTRADSNGQDYSPPGFATDSPGSDTRSVSRYGFAGADFDLLDGRWTHSLSVQGVAARRDNRADFARTGGDEGSRLKWSYDTTLRVQTGAVSHSFTAAYDHERETFQNTNPAGAFNADTTRRSVVNAGVVGQYDLAVGERWGGGLALRHDANDLFHDADTYRLQAYYRPSQTVRLRAAAGSGVKNPSQTELFGYNAAAFPFAGNPDLKPERSRGWEVGADLIAHEGAMRLSATWFDSTLHDEIYNVFGAPLSLCAGAGRPAPTSCTTSGNRASTSTRRGLEFSARARLADDLVLDAAYTHLTAREDGVQEIRRPPDTASANLTWRAPSDRGSATLTIRYNGQMTDSDFSAFPARTVAMKAFALVNLAGAWKLNPQLEAYGRIENLTGQVYQEVYGFQTPGRAVYAGLRARF